MAEYSLDIQGYYLQGKSDCIPASQGIFFVYRGLYDKERNMAILKELLYIGETSNLNTSVNNQDNSKYSKSFFEDERLFFSYAIIAGSENERKQIANILIKVTLPSYNIDASSISNCDGSIIRIMGDRHAFLPSIINFV